jgi:hypothetical protein
VSRSTATYQRGLSVFAGFALAPHAEARWGALRLTTTGRRSGEQRSVIVGYASPRSRETAVVILEPR